VETGAISTASPARQSGARTVEKLPFSGDCGRRTGSTLHCVTELGVQLARFFAMAAGEFGITSPHCRADQTTVPEEIRDELAARPLPIIANTKIAGGVIGLRLSEFRKSSAIETKFRRRWATPIPLVSIGLCRAYLNF
jgi:hypothetical protein